ncbi:hypothetical protein B0H14DRAFT_3616904 [Mycena olivaceomarginata]|nr:hypothetical protein B0H14DRAFT_3616904 [Mycena olivaceomarginata]
MSHATEYRNKPYANPPHHELLDAQREAKMRPLKRGDEFQLKLVIPPKNPDPLSRPVPFIPALSTTHFRLCDELQTGLGHFSQVWTAIIVSAPETTLIFKIIQPSMCYQSGEWKDRVHPDNLAGNEAWAYEHLKEKQITTPSKERAWVLVLEHIHGKTLTAVARSKSWDDIYRAVVGIDFQPMTVIEPSYNLVHVANRLEVEFFHAILDHFSE